MEGLRKDRSLAKYMKDLSKCKEGAQAAAGAFLIACDESYGNVSLVVKNPLLRRPLRLLSHRSTRHLISHLRRLGEAQTPPALTTTVAPPSPLGPPSPTVPTNA